MGAAAKSIQVCLLRIVTFSFNICSKFVIKHPLISSVFCLLSIFYIFLPKAFFFFIYSCPFLACTYIFIRFYWLTQSKNDRKVAKKSDAPTPRVVRKDGKSVRRTYTRCSSSRNMEVKRGESGSEEERKSRIIDDEILNGAALRLALEKFDRSIAAFDEKKRESKSYQAVKPDSCSKVETEISTSEDEEAKENRNKAVEWNEDDQKNLMDLGLSELERNKRLENLIARRRARKLDKAQTDKNLMSSIGTTNPFLVNPVSVARCNTFDVSYTTDLVIPGSAPSILLQRNPFDLPYDPFEEKPDLMADSFQQEFMAAQQKEMMFCRHESFTLGSFYPFPSPHRHQDEGNSSKGGGNSCADLNENSNQRKSQPEEIREAIKGKTVGNTAMENQAQKEMVTNNQHKCESSSSSVLENDEQAAKAKKSSNLTNLTPPPYRYTESPTPSSVPCPLPRGRSVNEMSYLASPATIDRSTLENHLLYTNSGPWHTPNDSIASDMQVEVSEVGSPPLTGDESASSNDGDSLTYDGDAEKEITSGSDEMWGISPRAPKQDQTSREENEFSEENISRGFSGHNKEPEGSVAQLAEHQTHQTNSDYNESSELQDPVDGVDSSVSDTSFQEEKGQFFLESMNFSEKCADEANVDKNLDVPVPSYDEEKSVEVRRENPETSIQDPKERESINSQDQAVEEITITDTNDIPVTTYDDLGEPKSTEFDVSRASQRSNDSSTSDVQQDSVVELPPTSSELSQNMQTGVSESSMEENMMSNKLLDELVPENSSLTPTLIEQHEIVASVDHPSTECNSPETSQPSGETVDKDREMVFINEPVDDDEKVKEEKSISNNKANVEMLNLQDVIESNSVEHTEGTSGNPSEYNSGIQQEKPEEQSECEKSTEHTNAASPTKHLVKDHHAGMPSAVEKEALIHGSTTIKDTIPDKISSNDQADLISETELQGIDESSDSMAKPNSVEGQDNISESLEGTESKSRNLTEIAVAINQSGGSNNSIDIEDPAFSQGNGSLKDDERIGSESNDLTEYGNAVDKVTITDETKATASVAT